MDAQHTKGKWTFGGIAVACGLICFTLTVLFCGMGIGVDGTPKQSAKKVACLSNMKQLGQGIQLYCDDNDGILPVTMGPTERSYEGGLGWAGKVLAYTKYGKASEYSILGCPTDYTDHQGEELPGGFTRLSYAFNSNLISTKPRIAEASAKTVMLFEVDGGMLNPNLRDEGRSKGDGSYLSMSPVGSGINGDLYDHLGTTRGPSLGQSIWYATGRLDNSAYNGLPDTFGERKGRHMEKANYLMADLSAKSKEAQEVSAGKTARNANDKQSETGCPAFPGSKGATNWPCAAGSGEKRHALTFSPL